MTLDQLTELTCKFFKVDEEGLLSLKRKLDFVIPRHIMRTVAVEHYKIPNVEVADYFKVNHATINNSRKKIFKHHHFNEEYKDFLVYLGLTEDTDVSTKEIVTEGNISRITQEAFDERFYMDNSKINPRTGNNYFAAYHYICSLGAPEDINLEAWKLDKGNFVHGIIKKAQIMGSYVHDIAEVMVKEFKEINCEQIDAEFRDPKDAHKVKNCLWGFINFCIEEEPIILNSETMVTADDWAFTLDLRVRLKRDNYKNIWIVDLKTSKAVYEGHKIQVECHRRIVGADKCAVLVLGNKTKKKYTFTEPTIKDRDYYWDLFNAWKNTAYVVMMHKGMVKPRVVEYPDVFTLKKLPIKIQFEKL